jgi:hypothetical protein
MPLSSGTWYIKQQVDPMKPVLKAPGT